MTVTSQGCVRRGMILMGHSAPQDHITYPVHTPTFSVPLSLLLPLCTTSQDSHGEEESSHSNSSRARKMQTNQGHPTAFHFYPPLRVLLSTPPCSDLHPIEMGGHTEGRGKVLPALSSWVPSKACTGWFTLMARDPPAYPEIFGGPKPHPP